MVGSAECGAGSSVAQLARALAGADTRQANGARSQHREGAPEMNDEKPLRPRPKWSAQRVITLVILLLILALVIYLKVTGAVWRHASLKSGGVGGHAAQPPGTGASSG